MNQAGCRHFNGYKPCSKHQRCDSQCPHLDVPQKSILIVHLGAMGAVLRSTALLTMIRRKYPQCSITWVTEDASRPLLANNPLIDRVLGLSNRDQLILMGLNFDVGFFIDKSPEIGGLRRLANPKESYGFVTSSLGAIIPANSSAQELWELGLDNHKKFFINKKTELQLIAESLELPYDRDPYVLVLTAEEKQRASERRRDWSQQGKRRLIGLNTGTSGVLPNKTIPESVWRVLINELKSDHSLQIVLLGGGTDGDRNERIGLNLPVIKSPTQGGLRDGLASMEAMDLVISGDSLGMHMAIALNKFVIAWFGPTCAHEIDLYDRGVKLISDFPCSPCWKRSCPESVPCCDRINLKQMLSALRKNLSVKTRGIESPESLDETASL